MLHCPVMASGFGLLDSVFCTLFTGALFTLPKSDNNMGLLDHINKIFDHRIRLGMMSILMVNEHVDFNRLKELLNVTDGNLASHSKTLEKANYIKIEKSFIGKKPNTRYSATQEGKAAFKKHIEALENIINKS